MKTRLRGPRRNQIHKHDMAAFDRAVRNAEPKVRAELLAAAARQGYLQLT